jgi:hypothetical protein
VTPPSVVDISALENSGFFFINDEQPVPQERTIIVLGVARSGTTMIAGALHHLGIDVGMGEKPNTVFEDVALAKAMENRDDAALRSLIEQRNAAHKIWGWKRPSTLDYIQRVQGFFRNPEYLIIFRDIFAIANRNRISVRSDMLTNMEDSLRRYRDMLAFIKACRSRAMLISYEKAMLNAGDFVEALARHLGVEDPTAIEKTCEFVRPNPEEYLLTSRSWGGQGRVEHVGPRQINGWGLMRGDTQPAQIKFWVNGVLAGSALADLQRDDLKGKVHPTGQCGFQFMLPEEQAIREGDVIRARIEGEIKDLNGSPRQYTPPKPKKRS